MSVSYTVRVGPKYGLHARPATEVVNMANNYSCEVKLLNTSNGRRANAKSIFDVLTLIALHDTPIVVTAAGDQEDEAAKSISQLIKGDFKDKTGGESSILPISGYEEDVTPDV
jgi:phosphotransferase system HPr (HPr) family protein